MRTRVAPGDTVRLEKGLVVKCRPGDRRKIGRAVSVIQEPQRQYIKKNDDFQLEKKVKA